MFRRLTSCVFVLPPCGGLAALVRLAETRFHISLESLQKLSDPCSILQQFLDKGEVSTCTRAICV